MITAVDTNVILDALTGEAPFAGPSQEAMLTCAADGSLIVCDVVWAETVAWFRSADSMEATMQRLDLRFVASSTATAEAAGLAWRLYRSEGGPRERVLPDFLVGAHAMIQADRLLTRDRGFFRRYFDSLRIVDLATP